MQRKSLLVLFFFLSLQTSFSQSGNLVFDHYTIDEGLSNNEIKCLAQDDNGFIWIGTKDGLNRFDGNSFEVYRSARSDSTSISGKVIFSLLVNHEGTLLVGTDEGLDYYDSDRDIFHPYLVSIDEQSINLNVIISLVEDSDHGLWIGTRSGLAFHDPESNVSTRYKHLSEDPSSLSGDYVHCVFEDSKSNVWVGTDGGLNLFNPESQTFTRYTPGLIDDRLSDIVFTSISEDPGGSLWLGTVSGALYKFFPDLGSFGKEQNSFEGSGGHSNNYISGIKPDFRGGLLVAGYREGLSIYNPENEKSTRMLHNKLDDRSIISDNIFCLLEDSQNNLWVGTGNGLSCHKDAAKSFKHFKRRPQDKNSLTSNLVKSIYEDAQGCLWIGTKEGGLNRLNAERDQFTHFPIPSEDVFAILEDTKGRIWFGGSDGLCSFDKQSETFASLSSSWVLSLAEEDEDHLWVGTSRGLNLVNTSTGQTETFTSNPGNPLSLPDSWIVTLYKDKLGYLWVGSALGLSVLNEDGVSFTNYQPSNSPYSISNKLILVIFEDSKGRFWIGTEDGLNLFDKKLEKFTHYTSNDGLADNVINGICEDDGGGLWISTNKGISLFNPDSMTFVNFDKYDGLQSNQFLNASYFRSKSGEMFFGGINGFNAFRPEEIKFNYILPPVILTNLSIINERMKPGMKNSPIDRNINEVEELVLNYNQRFFGLEFVALNYVNPNKNQYRFILEGFDKEWQQGINLRSVRYTNVPPGKYVFKLFASNNDGLWNKEGKILNIRIRQPYWLTWWAFTIYAFLFMALLLIFRRYSLIEANLKHRLMMEHFEKEKTEELNQLKMKFFTNISHELRTPLSLVISPLEGLLSREDLPGDTKSSLHIMHRNADRILLLINQLIEFRKSDTGHLELKAVQVELNKQIQERIKAFDDFAKQRDIELVFSAKQPEIDIYIDLDKFDKVLYNLLSNAFKFTKDNGKINIETSVESWDRIKSKLGRKSVRGDYACLEVSDNGQGIDPEHLDRVFDRFYQGENGRSNGNTGSGIGLALSKNLVELHQGMIDANNSQDGGAVFTIYLPLGKKHLKKSELSTSGIAFNPSISVIEDNREEQFAPSKEDAGADGNKSLPKLLIVEDDLDVRNYLVNDFSKRFTVLTAGNGKEGLEKAKKEFPDIIISDVMMPEMDGIEFCKKLKSDVLISHIPVILLTAKNSIEYQKQGLESGADDYVIKPFNLEILGLKVNNLLESRQRLRKEFKSKPAMQLNALSLASADKKFLEKVIKLIEQNIKDPAFSVEVLGDKVAMSRSNLYRKINALTGQTAIEFIRSIKLKEAARMLLENKEDVYDIMEVAGFQNIKYFRKCFLTQFGCKPEDYFDITEEMNASGDDPSDKDSE